MESADWTGGGCLNLARFAIVWGEREGEGFDWRIAREVSREKERERERVIILRYCHSGVVVYYYSQ